MPRIAAFSAMLLALLLCPNIAAQDLDNRSAEFYERIWFVPHLGGAVSFEGGLVQPLSLGLNSGYPTTWFVGAGWKHYLEGHGRAQVRLMLTYEHGGLLNRDVEGTANRIGGSAAFTLRGISQEWLFGQLSLLADLSYISLRPPAGPFPGEKPDTRGGIEIGFGVESTFGSMFVLDPYLMAETGASATIARVQVGGLDTWEIWARLIFRFDIGVRNAEE